MTTATIDIVDCPRDDARQARRQRLHNNAAARRGLTPDALQQRRDKRRARRDMANDNRADSQPAANLGRYHVRAGHVGGRLIFATNDATLARSAAIGASRADSNRAFVWDGAALQIVGRYADGLAVVGSDNMLDDSGIVRD